MRLPKHSDFVTLHTPLTPKTKGLINADFFAKAKPKFWKSMWHVVVLLMKRR